MNDKDIIKALECCIKHTECPKCPMKGTRNCMSELNKDTLNLINRQKAELGRLQKSNRNWRRKCQRLRKALRTQKAEIERLTEEVNSKYKWENKLDKTIKETESEAIKKFWDKLKAEKITHKNLGELVYVEDGDNLVKEMTEGKE